MAHDARCGQNHGVAGESTTTEDANARHEKLFPLWIMSSASMNASVRSHALRTRGAPRESCFNSGNSARAKHLAFGKLHRFTDDMDYSGISCKCLD